VERLLTLGLANAAAATALAVLVAVFARCLQRRPVLAHNLWFLVLLKLVTPPLFEVPLPWASLPELASRQNEPEPSQPTMAVALVLDPQGASDEATLSPAGVDYGTVEAPGLLASLSLAETAKTGWLAGSALVLLLAAVRIARFRRLLRLAEPAPEEVQDQVWKLCQRLGLSRVPIAWQIDLPLTPLLWAVGCRPRLIIPTQLWKRLDARQRTVLLAHELAHLKRGDHLLRLFELVVTACFWWLPTLWWARKQLRDAEEECCDAWVVWAYPEDARTYAETLLDTVDFLEPSRSAVPLLASGFGRAHHLLLQRRLTMIMLGTTPRRLSLVSALSAFGLAACLLPLTPSWAQDPVEKDDSQAITFTVQSDQQTDPTTAVDTQVQVVVASDGELQEIKSDSIDKAVAELKHRIDALTKEKGGSEAKEAQIKALKQAIGSIEKTRSKVLILKKAEGTADPAKAKDEQKVVVLRGKISAENRAKVEKARARIAAIQKDLVRKQKELAEAQLDLAKLSVVEPQFAVGSGSIKVEPLAKKARGERLELDLHSSSMGPEDHARLEALEKKLSKLLDEVASLRLRDQLKGNQAK
jgi:beta-lactamase regulating signal transducer with metallopeptidase domain